MRKLGKKGSILDLIFIAVGLIVFAVATLLAFKIMSEFNDNVQANADIPTEAKTASNTLEGDYSGILDKSFLFICIGLAIGALILASLVRVHPIFFVFYLIALVFIIFMSGVFSNIYQTMAETPQLSTQADELVMISSIMEFLPFIIGIFGFILAGVMFKLWSNEQI